MANSVDDKKQGVFMAVKLGKPSYGGGNTQKKNYFKIQDGDNVFRILPPMHSLADQGVWSKYYSVEYGYKGTDGKMKPFLCCRVKNYKTKMIDVECPACLNRAKKEDRLKGEVEALKAGMGSADTVKELKAEVDAFNCDSKHYVNAMDLSGNIGLLKIGYKCMQSLRELIKRMEAEGIDPIGVENGRFFTFSRSGKGRDTVYTVAEYKQKKRVSVEGVETMVDVPMPHSLTEAIIVRLEHEAFDLSTLFKSISVDECQDIVARGAVAIDKIFSKQEVQPEEEEQDSVAQTKGISFKQPPAQDIGFIKPEAQPIKEVIQPPKEVIAERQITQPPKAATKIEPKKAPATLPPAGDDVDALLKDLGL